MKKMSFSLTLILLVSFCVCGVEAAPAENTEIVPLRASDYFSIYSTSATSSAKGEVVVDFIIYAKSTMNTIGATKIVIQEKNGTAWEESTTKVGTVYNGLLGSNTDEFSGSYTYSGVSGRTYRAIVTIYAKDAFGSDSRTVVTKSVVAK